MALCKDWQEFAAVNVTELAHACHVIPTYTTPLEKGEDFSLRYQQKLPLLLVGESENLKVCGFIEDLQ